MDITGCNSDIQHVTFYMRTISNSNEPEAEMRTHTLKGLALCVSVMTALAISATSAVAAWYNPLSFFNGHTTTNHFVFLKNPIARLYNFYSATALLPVLHPSGEQPGDVYVDIIGGRYIARRAQCFPGLKPRVGGSNIPTMKKAETLDLTGGFHAAIDDAQVVSGSAGLKFSKTGAISFHKVTAATTTLVELEHRLKKRDKDCSNVARSLMTPSSPRNAAQGIILASVWSGTKAANWAVQSYINGKIGVDGSKLQKLVNNFAKKIDAEGFLNVNVGAQLMLNQSVAQQITMVSRRRLPVAWLPMNISVPNLQELLEALKHGKIRALVSIFNRSRSLHRSKALAMLNGERFSKDFGYLLGSPKEIAAKAARGPYIAFNANNVEHLRYIAALDTQLALSYELNAER